MNKTTQSSQEGGAVEFAAGGFRYIPAVFQYSAGVTASAGFRIRRVRFQTPLPIPAGFAAAARIIQAAGRPLTAFCACELRSPAPFSDDGFRKFNQSYVVTLGDWGIMENDRNPVARSNVCPEIDPPPGPSFHAFCFTVESSDAAPSFVISGSGEAREGGASYAERTVRHGETSTGAMHEKAVFVLGKWNIALRSSAQTGPRPQRRRSTRFTISILSSPGKSCVGARRAPG